MLAIKLFYKLLTRNSWENTEVEYFQIGRAKKRSIEGWREKINKKIDAIFVFNIKKLYNDAEKF